MSQVDVVAAAAPATPAVVPDSASRAEKHATPPMSAQDREGSVKARSCVVCRTRKVRCDKRSPCSNCRRANIDCVFPSADRPPRWARRLERLSANATAITNIAATPPDADMGVDKVLDRLRNIERVVSELSGQLQQARAAATSPLNTPATSNPNRNVEQPRDPSPATHSGNVHKDFGRLVSQDASRRRYVSSGFWSRIDDELNGLKMDARDLTGDGFDGSDEEEEEDDLSGEVLSSRKPELTPSERHAFLFRHNLATPVRNLGEIQPLPSQIPFLLDVFSENVNIFIRIVHMPTVTQMVRGLRCSGMACLTPSNEALMCSIYYAAIVSMEEDDIKTNFGSSRPDLTHKYRLGLEHALAKADFLNAPDIVLVQALAIFLCLARRNDSPRFVWMMTGLVIRMAQYLGLQRDGDHFEHLTPFEIEMRRRIWWVIYFLDARASEDQGTDLTITSGSFDTKVPLNINDVDIDPESKHTPEERSGITDMSFGRLYAGILVITRQMMDSCVGDGVAGLEGQNRLLNEIHQKIDREYFRHAKESESLVYWVAVTMARLIMAKLRLLVSLPVLFSSPSKHTSEEIRITLLLSAIEVAEYNHALNAEKECRQWRWLYQTCTHWYAIVYIMMEISRRSWSPIVERAWVALHSRWLIPAQAFQDKTLHIWVPLRKLMDKARKHRNAELKRLRADPEAANKLEGDDRTTPLPSSPGPFLPGSSVDMFRERWRQLVTVPEGCAGCTHTSGADSAGLADSSMQVTYTSQPSASFFPAFDPGDFGSEMILEPMYLGPAITTDAPTEMALGENARQLHVDFPTVPADWSYGGPIEPDLWLWADGDPSVDVFANSDMDLIDANLNLDGDMDWYNWVETAKGME